MKLVKEKKYSKVVKLYEIVPDSGAFLEITFENSKFKAATLTGKFSAGGKKPDCWPTVVKPEFFEFIKRSNPWYTIGGDWGWKGLSYSPEELAKELIRNPDLTIDAECFLWVYHSGHVVFDRFGDPVPIPYGFDYIGTPFENSNCDLDKMLPHLKSHPWVINGDELHIEEVPYYNNEEGWRKYIRGEKVSWVEILPSKEALKEIYQRALEIDREYFSVRMKELITSDKIYNWEKTKEKDWLEIRQFAKKHPKHVY